VTASSPRQESPEKRLGMVPPPGNRQAIPNALARVFPTGRARPASPGLQLLHLRLRAQRRQGESRFRSDP